MVVFDPLKFSERAMQGAIPFTVLAVNAIRARPSLTSWSVNRQGSWKFRPIILLFDGRLECRPPNAPMFYLCVFPKSRPPPFRCTTLLPTRKECSRINIVLFPTSIVNGVRINPPGRLGFLLLLFFCLFFHLFVTPKKTFEYFPNQSV